MGYCGRSIADVRMALTRLVRNSRSHLVADLDQVVVGVAQVEGAEWPARAIAINRSQLDGHAEGGEVAFVGVQRRGGEEAEIAGAGGGTARFRLELVSRLV